ncbi:MAG: C40 family peptidase [Mycobacteriaceae bacterium]|nr:C40 family peptidase [Mycobacteriaceae bacterium]
MGRPYVWGAKGPDAFDCSGLLRWSYAQAGVTLGADTYSQFQQGISVAPGEVQAGDMVFPKSSFGEGGHAGPGHVMLAISPTECVEAQQSGVPVKVSPMPSAFFARRPTIG